MKLFLSRIFFGIPEKEEKTSPVLSDEAGAKNFSPLTASDETESLIRMMASNEKMILSNWQESLCAALYSGMPEIAEDRLTAQTEAFFKCFLKEFSENNEEGGFSSSAESIRTIGQYHAEQGLPLCEILFFLSSFRDTIFRFIPEIWESVPRRIVSEMIRIHKATAMLERVLTEAFFKMRESQILRPFIVSRETLRRGSDLIVNFIRGLNIVEKRIENDTMSVILALQEIVQKSREGSEQAEAVFSRFLGNTDTADIQMNSSYAARVIRENQAVVNKADSVFQTLDQINRSVSESLNTIVDKVRQIHRVVAEVDEIASQSKVLAFNAAIEASKAGENGRRFAVVAKEIRNFAEMSAQSAASIGNSAEESVEVVKSLKYKIDTQIVAGSSEMEKAEENFKTAYNQFKEFTDNISEAIETLTFRYQAIAEDIENATVALQFQDMISQEIAEITASMTDFRSQIEYVCNILKSPENSSEIQGLSLFIPREKVLTGESSAYSPRIHEKKEDDVEFF